MAKSLASRGNSMPAYGRGGVVNLKRLYSDLLQYKLDNNLNILDIIAKTKMSTGTFYAIFENPRFDLKISQLQAIAGMMGKFVSDYIETTLANTTYAWPSKKQVSEEKLPRFRKVNGYRELYAHASYIYTWLFKEFPDKISLSIDTDRSVSIIAKVNDNINVVLKMYKNPREDKGSGVILIDNKLVDDKAILTKKAFTAMSENVVKDFVKIYKRELIKYEQ